MNFKVGQKVVCVDDKPCGHEGYSKHGICEGRVYTVRAINKCPVQKRWGLCLEEIVNPIHPVIGEEYMFRASRFRPVVERKTDTGMAILKSILNDADRFVAKETV